MKISISQPINPSALVALIAINKNVEQTQGHSAWPDGEAVDTLTTDPTTTAIIATEDNIPVGAIYFSSSTPTTSPVASRGAMAFTQPPATMADQQELLAATLDEASRQNLSSLEIWWRGGNEEMLSGIISADLMAYRKLFELEIPLPLAPELSLSATKKLATLTLRKFVVGQDEEAWIIFNQRAFAKDPDQGIWTRATLDERLNRQWFDPDLFLVAEIDGRIVGTCWMQIHHATTIRPSFGEIYVIGVDPDFQGQGLGKALVVAGLDLITQKNHSAGGLFVDAINTSAVELYSKIGFKQRRTDYAFRWLSPNRPQDLS